MSNGTAGYSGHDLPRREITLPELSAILIHPPCGFAASNAVWHLLIGQGRGLPEQVCSIRTCRDEWIPPIKKNGR